MGDKSHQHASPNSHLCRRARLRRSRNPWIAPRRPVPGTRTIRKPGTGNWLTLTSNGDDPATRLLTRLRLVSRLGPSDSASDNGEVRRPLCRLVCAVKLPYTTCVECQHVWCIGIPRHFRSMDYSLETLPGSDAKWNLDLGPAWPARHTNSSLPYPRLRQAHSEFDRLPSLSTCRVRRGQDSVLPASTTSGSSSRWLISEVPHRCSLRCTSRPDVAGVSVQRRVGCMSSRSFAASAATSAAARSFAASITASTSVIPGP